MGNSSTRDKYYNRTDGVLYVDGTPSTNEQLLDAGKNTRLTLVAHQVEPGPTVPRLVTKERRIVGKEAIVAFLTEHGS